MPSKIIFNAAQIEELRKLVSKGMRQEDVAKHFNVTADTIRRICKENNIQVKMPYQCTCVICGDKFYSNIRNAKTCSKEHKQICAICGKEFIVDRYNIRNTCSPKCYSLQKYGVEHPSSARENVEKRKLAIKEKYGVNNVSQLADHAEKSENTCLTKYGATSYAGSQEGRAHIQSTNLDRYGYREPFKDSARRAEFDLINIERYGTAHPSQCESIKNKTRQTNIEKYGVPNVMQNDEIKGRLKDKNEQKYGTPYLMRVDEIKEKVSATCLERYGVAWACMRPEARAYRAKSKVNDKFAELLRQEGLEFETEFPLANYSFDFKVGSTLIEIDPTITHNSAISIFPGDPLTSDYHAKKTQAAQAAGYRCIHIFDWDNWNDIVNLLHPKQRIHGRKCSVVTVSRAEAEQFTSLNHIQGSCKGQVVNLGLAHDGELVELMTFGKPRYNSKFDWELLRLCTRQGCRVIGGASKLFSYFTSQYSGSIISYCDCAKFSGEVYAQIGMHLDYQTDPSKIWSKKDKKITDNLLRQRGFDQLFGTNYGKGTSNEELMLQDGWLPVYDCGQKVFTYIC